MTKFLNITGFSLIFFCFDRASKLWAEANLAESPLHIFGDFFQFKLQYNENLALSLPFPLFGQIVLSVILLILLIIYFTKFHLPTTKWEMFAVVLIFGGALGNIVDRILFHHVVDFISVWSFPVFNLADTFLFLGVFFFLIAEMFCQKKK